MKTIDLTAKFYRGCAGGCVRMSKELQACFNTPHNIYLRVQCQSGVRICFSTDAREMVFSMVFGDAVRQVFTSDLFIDGKMTTLTGEGPHRIELAEGEKNITIHLPHLVLIDKFELAVNDGAEVKPLPRPEKTILFCGDSIMQGMTTTSPALAPAPRIAAGLNMDFINTSFGGAKMNPEHIRLTALLPGDIMIVALGTNDSLSKKPLDVFTEDVRKSLKIFAAFAGGKYLILPIPNPGVPPGLDEYRRIIRTEAETYPEIRIIDGYEFYPADLEYYCDKTHPNDQGAELYARQVVKVIGA